MRYDLYKGAAFVASYQFDGEPPELHPNKGRLLKNDPPSYDPATQKRVQDAVTEESTEVTYTVSDLTTEELDALHPRKMLSGFQAITLISDVIGETRFEEIWDDNRLKKLQRRVNSCRDVDPADMPGVFALIASVDETYITQAEQDAIMAAWPRA